VANIRSGDAGYVVPLQCDQRLLGEEEAMQSLAELVHVVDAESILLVFEGHKTPAAQGRPSGARVGLRQENMFRDVRRPVLAYCAGATIPNRRAFPVEHVGQSTLELLLGDYSRIVLSR
jgi:hypothetical protein